MHEMGLALEIRRIAREAVAGRGPGRVEIVRVAVGELSAVEPELLAFAWEAAVAGTEDAASKLEVDFRPARQTCRACGEIAGRAPGSWLRLCPRCGDALEVSGGDDLDVLSVAFEEEVVSGGARP
jgi:hydrogenase nickel incorporation protein HypA/HybF